MLCKEKYGKLKIFTITPDQPQTEEKQQRSCRNFHGDQPRDRSNVNITNQYKPNREQNAYGTRPREEKYCAHGYNGNQRDRERSPKNNCHSDDRR